MMRVPLFAVLVILGLYGLPKESHANEEDDYYYGEEFYNPEEEYPEPDEPTLISSKKLSEIENITQQIVIRLIKKENRIMSKNMDDASEKCVKLAAIFEEKCANCQAKPNLIATVLDKAKKLLKLHPRYWKIQIGKKILKGFKRIRVRRIVKNIGKNIKGLGKKIGKVWRKVGSKVRRTVRRITRRLRRVVRVRVRLPRVRVRLPRVRLPRVRVRLPRIRTPRVRFRFRRRRRWGKKKRSPCSDCERMSEMSEDDQLNSLCPFLLSVNKKSLQTDRFLNAIVSEVESGFPKLEKILHHHYLSSDEADVTISAKEGKHSYKLKNFSKLSSEQIGRAVGRYIFNKAKPKQ